MFQQLIAIGHLGQDPESRTTSGGTSVTNFSVAVSERWKDKQSGEMKEKTEWLRCVAWGRTGEIAAEYLRKGSLVTVIGVLQTNKWQDKEGNDRYTTEIKVNELKLMPNGDRAGGGQKAQQSGGSSRGNTQQARQSNTANGHGSGQRQAPPPQAEDFDDDIPF